MLYVIKFFTSFLFPPGIFILLQLLAGVLLYQKARRVSLLLLISGLLFYTASIPLVGETLTTSLEKAYTPPVQLNGDVLVMLQGGATLDTPDINGNGNLTGDAANRLLTTARLYNMTKLPILLSGGIVYPDDGPTYDIAKRQLIALGVPAQDILVDDKSRTTQENAEYSKAILEQHHFTHPILITSAFHMKRSVLDFHNVGITVVPYPCGYTSNLSETFYLSKWVPTSVCLSLTETALHEYLGILAALAKIPG